MLITVIPVSAENVNADGHIYRQPYGEVYRDAPVLKNSGETGVGMA